MLAAAAQPVATVDSLIGMPWQQYLDAFGAWVDAQRELDAVRGLQAMQLAPTLDIYRALIAGEDVPKDRLDPKWRRAYGIR